MRLSDTYGALFKPVHYGIMAGSPTVMYKLRADSRFAPSQWEKSLQSKAVSHWLGANQESALQSSYRHLDHTTKDCLDIKTVFPGMGIPIIKIRQSSQCHLHNGNPHTGKMISWYQDGSLFLSNDVEACLNVNWLLSRYGHFHTLCEAQWCHIVPKRLVNIGSDKNVLYTWYQVITQANDDIYCQLNPKQGKSEGFESCDWPIVRKWPIWVKIGGVLSCVTLKFDGWPWKTIGHLSFAVSSFVQHFIAIGEFKLELQSGSTPFGSNSTIFFSRVTLQFDRWHWKPIGHLFYATSSFVHHFIAIGELKLELQSGNAQFGSNSTNFRAKWPWNLTDDLEKQ